MALILRANLLTEWRQRVKALFSTGVVVQNVITKKTILICALLMFTTVCALPNNANAADITQYSDPVMNCGILVSGPISNGDTKILLGQIHRSILREKFFGSFDINSTTENPIISANYSDGTMSRLEVDITTGEMIRTSYDADGLITSIINASTEYTDLFWKNVCFNSLGGSFSEGLKITELLGVNAIGTAIAAQHSCESACAVAFMAGSWSRRFWGHERFEGQERGPATRTLHPKGTLGFHATSLPLRSEQYTSLEVQQAYAIALETVNMILRLRANKGYNFPDYVLSRMLETPPSDMFYIDTVESATRADIIVAPTGINLDGPEKYIPYLCDAANVHDLESDSILEYLYDLRINYSEERWGSEGTHWMMDLVDTENGRQCHVSLLQYPESDFRSESFGGIVSFPRSTNSADEIDTYDLVHEFQTFPLATRLENLPLKTTYSLRDARLLAGQQAIEASAAKSCWLTKNYATIENVTEFTNLRRQPTLSSIIIREVPLRERVRISDIGSLKVAGTQSRRDSCETACNDFQQNPNDTNAKDEALQCIDENVLWTEITDAGGNTGWVSRKFLQEID
jgi:hypothetical protein